MLNATVNSQVVDSALSRTGLYLHHNRYQNDNIIILFRGNSFVGKTQGIMPHRKWRLEFRVDQFPSFDEIVSLLNLPLSESYILTQYTTLTGTSDNVVFMSVPITGKNGTFYGICGYEISEDYFSTYHIQPTTEYRIVCMLLSKNIDNTYASTQLSCSGQNNYVQPHVDTITIKKIKGKLSKISDSNQSFIGVCKPITLTPNNNEFTLAVMIPQSDYTNALIKISSYLVVFLMLLLFFTISCCIYFSRQYLSPILKGLEQIKDNTWDTQQSTMPEINDLFAFLAKQDAEHSSAISSVQNELAEVTRTYQEAQNKYSEVQAKLEKAQIELERLSYSRKTEVDPENYQAFLAGLKTLTPTEKIIFHYYMEGKSVKQIMEIAGIKETTIRFHNRNIYSKLNVNSLKQLLLYASMMQQTKKDS